MRDLNSPTNGLQKRCSTTELIFIGLRAPGTRCHRIATRGTAGQRIITVPRLANASSMISAAQPSVLENRRP